MVGISQKEHYRQSLIKYAMKYSITKATIKYKTNRQYVYRWMTRYDGSLKLLSDKIETPLQQFQRPFPC